MASGSAFMDNMRRMSFQTSSLAHSRKRLCTVFQGPNSGCKSRHGAPVFIIHRIALNIRRSSLRLRPLVSVPAFANIGPIMAHFSSEMSCLLMEKQKQQTDEKSRFYLETAPSTIDGFHALASSYRFTKACHGYPTFIRQVCGPPPPAPFRVGLLNSSRTHGANIVSP